MAGKGEKAENASIEIIFQRGKFIGLFLGERLRICNAKCPLKGLHVLDQVVYDAPRNPLLRLISLYAYAHILLHTFIS